MLCPSCKTAEARKHPTYGVMPCHPCTARRRGNQLPGSQVEFTSEKVKEQRRAYAKSILQPFREGIPSQEFAESYPDKAAKMFEGHGKPQRVWSDQPNISNLENTQ